MGKCGKSNHMPILIIFFWHNNNFHSPEINCVSDTSNTCISGSYLFRDVTTWENFQQLLSAGQIIQEH